MPITGSRRGLMQARAGIARAEIARESETDMNSNRAADDGPS